MAECTGCGKTIKSWQSTLGGTCSTCHSKIAKQVVKKDNEQRQEALEAIMLTTETAPNLNITKRIEIVTAECAFGMNIFKDLFAGVRDIVGGRSEAV